MCRWIIFMGQKPLLLEDLLIQPNHSIVEQVHERFLPGLFYNVDEADKAELKDRLKYLFNVHGFGLIWYTDTLSHFDDTVKGLQPAQFRTIAPISTDLAFKQLCRHTASTCVLAHIRAASFPPVVEINNHPFIYGNITFQHNGGIASFNVIRFDVIQKIKELQSIVQAHPQTIKPQSSVKDGDYVFALLGNTDTEHLALLFIAWLDIIRAVFRAHGASQSQNFGTTTMLLALVLAIDDIHSIQKINLVGPFRLGGNGYTGNTLNICVADGGTEMLATRWRDSPNGQPASLYLSFTAGEKLNRKYTTPPVLKGHDLFEDDDVKIQSVTELVARYKSQPPSPQGLHLIVGSEPCTRERDDWALFDKNQCLTLDKHGNVDLQLLDELFADGIPNTLRKKVNQMVMELSDSGSSPPIVPGFGSSQNWRSAVANLHGAVSNSSQPKAEPPQQLDVGGILRGTPSAIHLNLNK
ncbi:hypothetical protein GYMLUDRAFT_889262 [Collybiopsis luxurians FD-317 M1]|uniref:Glutamine amidotransferase type-2 domain-containing protein n=1 Tax=Collybiopsis luxurians FD-317 M1 TaxID=944289 RepID=A0A0D0BJH3_9AGAR|nr:hypothetical protein GYMLUDRAFT_889262 [Collybiopsis luxurians FD-317 M1]